MRAIGKINIRGARFVSRNEGASAWSGEGMTGFVVFGQISFRLDNFTRAVSPNKFGTNQFARADDRITPKESSRNNAVFHEANAVLDCDPRELETLRVEINRQLHFASDWFAIAKRRNELRLGKIGKRSFPESKKRRLFVQDTEVLQVPVGVDL